MTHPGLIRDLHGCREASWSAGPDARLAYRVETGAAARPDRARTGTPGTAFPSGGTTRGYREHTAPGTMTRDRHREPRMTTHPEPIGPLAERPSRVLVRLMAAASLLRIGETEAGLRFLRSVVAAWPEDPLPRYRLAVALAWSGRGLEALDALTGSVDAGLAAPDDLATEPAFDRLRGDPQFLAALAGARLNRAGESTCTGESSGAGSGS